MIILKASNVDVFLDSVMRFVPSCLGDEWKKDCMHGCLPIVICCSAVSEQSGVCLCIVHCIEFLILKSLVQGLSMQVFI